MLKKIVIQFICLFYPKKYRAYVKMNLRSIGSKIHIKRRAKFIGKNVHCGENVRINKKTVINDNTSFGDLNVLGHGDFIVGKNCIFGHDLLVITTNHNYTAKKLPFEGDDIIRPVEIGDYCWLGTKVILLPGTKIGEGAIIQAGAVVHGEIPPLSIAGGNPAKVFKYRDKEHYYKIKAEMEEKDSSSM